MEHPRPLQVCTIVCIIYDAHRGRGDQGSVGPYSIRKKYKNCAMYVIIFTVHDKKMFLKTVLWIRIRIGSVFRSFVDPDTYSQYGFGSTHVNIG